MERAFQLHPRLRSISSKDISEDAAGQVAEIRVAEQALQERLFERFSGASPQPLPDDHFTGTVSPGIFSCRPATSSKLRERIGLGSFQEESFAL